MTGRYEERMDLCREMARIARQVPGIVGAYVEGPFHDENSDIDMGVVYDEEVISKVEAQSRVHRLLEEWLEEREEKTGKRRPSYLTHLPYLYSIQEWRMDLHVKSPFLDIQEDINLSHWWDGERWEDLNLTVLFDQTGEIYRHIEAIRKCSPDLFLRRARFALERIDYFIGGIGRNLDRGDMLSALYNLTQAMTDVVHGLYAVNLRHCPYEKWAITYLDGLRRKPKSLRNKVARVLTLPSMTRDAIMERTKILQELANWLREEADALEERISKRKPDQRPMFDRFDR